MHAHPMILHRLVRVQIRHWPPGSSPNGEGRDPHANPGRNEKADEDLRCLPSRQLMAFEATNVFRCADRSRRERICSCASGDDVEALDARSLARYK